MEDLISFKTESGHVVYLQATEIDKSSEGMELVSINENAVVKRASQTLSEALEPVKSVAQSILKAFNSFDFSPDEIGVELSIKITAEAGVIITKGAVEGNFKISLKWKKDQD